MGHRLHLHPDLVGVRLRGVRHRLLLTGDRGRHATTVKDTAMVTTATEHPGRRRTHHRRLRVLVQPAAPHAPPRPSPTRRSRGPVLFPTRDPPPGRLTEPRGCMKPGTVHMPSRMASSDRLFRNCVLRPWDTSISRRRSVLFGPGRFGGMCMSRSLRWSSSHPYGRAIRRSASRSTSRR